MGNRDMGGENQISTGIGKPLYSEWGNLIILITINLFGILACLIWHLLLKLPESYMMPCYELSEFFFFVFFSNMFSSLTGVFIGYVGRKWWGRLFKVKLTGFSAAFYGAVIFFVVYFILSLIMILAYS